MSKKFIVWVMFTVKMQILVPLLVGSVMATFSLDVNAAFTVGLGLVAGVLLGLIGILLGRILPPSQDYPLKRERFEAGNPPKGRARGWFSMQYYPYLIIFLTVEPIVVYSFLYLLATRSYPYQSALLLTLILLVLIPPLIFGLESARRIRGWLVGEGG